MRSLLRWERFEAFFKLLIYALLAENLLTASWSILVCDDFDLTTKALKNTPILAGLALILKFVLSDAMFLARMEELGDEQASTEEGDEDEPALVLGLINSVGTILVPFCLYYLLSWVRSVSTGELSRQISSSFIFGILLGGLLLAYVAPNVSMIAHRSWTWQPIALTKQAFRSMCNQPNDTIRAVSQHWAFLNWTNVVLLAAFGMLCVVGPMRFGNDLYLLLIMLWAVNVLVDAWLNRHFYFSTRTFKWE